MKEALHTIENTLQKYEHLKNKDIGTYKFHDGKSIDENTTEVEYNKEGKIDSITRIVKGEPISLTYIKNAFIFDPELFITTQAIAHQIYFEIINKDLTRTLQETSGAIDTKNDFENTYGIETDYRKNNGLEILHIMMTPTYWFRGTTRARENRRIINTFEASIVGNTYLKEALTQGKEFIDKLVIPQVKKDFKGTLLFLRDAEEISMLQKDMIFIHRRMALEYAKQLNIYLKYEKNY